MAIRRMTDGDLKRKKRNYPACMTSTARPLVSATSETSCWNKSYLRIIVLYGNIPNRLACSGNIYFRNLNFT